MSYCDIGSVQGVVIALVHMGCYLTTAASVAVILYRTFNGVGWAFKAALVLMLLGVYGRMAGFIETGCRTVTADEAVFTLGVAVAAAWVAICSLQGTKCRPCVYEAWIAKPAPIPGKRWSPWLHPDRRRPS